MENLIFFIPSLAKGGAERVAVRLLPELSKAFSLTLFLIDREITYPVPEGLEIISMNDTTTGTLSHLLNIPGHVLSLSRIVKRKGAEIVLSFLEEANIINLLSSKLTGHKTVISQHTPPILQYKRKGALGKAILSASKRFYPKADHIIAVSKGIKEMLIKEYRLSQHKITVIPNPIDLVEINANAKVVHDIELPARFILNAGRIQFKVKGQDILIMAFGKIAHKFPDVFLVFLGEGPDLAGAIKLAKDSALSEKILFLGWREDVLAIMSRSEVFVLSSRYEGWPNVLVEAMACKCPVIATDCLTGPKEILDDGKYGILVPPEDPDTLARSLELMLEDAGMRNRYGKLAYDRAKVFEVSGICGKYIEVIKRVTK